MLKVENSGNLPSSLVMLKAAWEGKERRRKEERNNRRGGVKEDLLGAIFFQCSCFTGVELEPFLYTEIRDVLG